MNRPTYNKERKNKKKKMEGKGIGSGEVIEYRTRIIDKSRRLER